jgi:hypothetical protein
MNDENYGFVYKPSDREAPEYCEDAWTVDMKIENNNIQCEHGSDESVGFLDPGQAKLYDSNGNEVFCKCGKRASETMIFKDGFIALCSNCAIND